MGEKLAAAGAGNKHGHFEDKGFLELHKRILRENKCHMYVNKGQLYISDENRKFAEKLVNYNASRYSVWG